MTYDGSLQKSVSFSGDVSGTVAWGHDTDFRVTSETVNGGWNATFAYDDDSLLTAAGALTLVRDPESGMVTSATSGNVTEEWTYNDYGEVETKVSSFSGTPFFALAYVRDNLGRITEKTETISGVTKVHAYTYDPAGRLETVTENGVLVESYQYDANGNRTEWTNSAGTFTAAYDAQDRIISYGDFEYEFHENGELATKTDIVTNEVTSYTYDALGNLRGVALPNGDVIEYLVDGRGRRVGKKVNGVLVKQWLWRAPLQPVAELDGAGGLVARFVYAGGMNVPALMVTPTATYELIRDQLGSVRAVVDASSGAVVQEIVYDSWGRVLSDTSPGLQPFGYAGGMVDAASGLDRYGVRDFDPEIGRWTSADPILFSGGINLYEYANGDPNNLVDPTGTQSLHEVVSKGALWTSACLIAGKELSEEYLSGWGEDGDERAHCYASCFINRCMALQAPTFTAEVGFVLELLDIPGTGFSMRDLWADLNGVLYSYNLLEGCDDQCEAPIDEVCEPWW